MPALSIDDERHVAIAIGDARDFLVSKGLPARGQDIVMEALECMADLQGTIDGYEPVGPRKLRAQFFMCKTGVDEDALKQRLIDIAAGDDPDKVLGIFRSATPDEVSRVESVMRVFRDSLVGEVRVRDWAILKSLAEGFHSARSIGRDYGLSHWSVLDRRNLQCAAIWKNVRHLLPPAKEIKAAPNAWQEADIAVANPSA